MNVVRSVLLGALVSLGLTSTALQAEEKTLRLYALDCGSIDMLDLGVFSYTGKYDGQTNKASDPCFLISHPTKGELLWDTGLPQSLIELPEGLVNGAFHLSVKEKLTDQLASIGMKPEDIEYLSLSHSHFDHIGNAGLFAASTFIINDNEYAYMFRDEAKADANTYPSYSALENAKTIKFKGDYDVFGDGSVEIIATPGHSPGHSSLLIHLKNTGPVLLTGDLYHLTQARELKTVPVFNTDIPETLKSMEKFERIAATDGARVIIQHEKDDFEDLPKFPAYLD